MKITGTQWALVAAAAALLGGLGYAFAPRAVPVEIVPVIRGPLRVTVDEDGRTRIRERYIVSAPLAGQMRRITLEPGDCVTAGKTVIAIIEPAEPSLLDPRTRAELEARLRAAEAQVQQAGARLERTRAAEELAQADFSRSASLADRKVIAPQELDRAREAMRVAREDAKAAEYARQVAVFELEQARAALSRVREDAGTNGCAWEMTVVSPVDGRVLRLFQEDAGVVAPGTRLLEIGEPGDLEAEIDVLSVDAVKIRPGAKVFFERWGGDAALEGRVRVVEPAGFLKISALGVEEQRVNVIVDFVSPPENRPTLGDAYRVEARIVVWESDGVLKVPVGALFRREGAWAVFAVREQRARVVTVQTGQSDGRETEIVRGLEAGAHVIVHASDKVADGVKITPRTSR